MSQPGAGNRSIEPGEVALRAEIEKDVRAELEPQFDDKVARERAKARLALFISTTFAAAVLTPAAALLLGAAVRLFFWSSGLR